MLLAMVAWLLSISPSQAPASVTPVDVSTVKVGPPSTVTELDLRKLKGELREIGWSPDLARLYVQTADGDPPSAKRRHYLVPSAGGAATPVDAQPEWAAAYWEFKSDRAAPGIASLMIDFEQKLVKMKIGTGSGRPGEMAGGSGGGVAVDIEKTAEGQHQNVARLTLLGETISEFINQVPIPGLMFSWGPVGSGAIAYTDRETGHLLLLDQRKHKQTVAGVKDALLPAWSTDGTRLAWVQKAGRKKFTLLTADVSLVP
jgi:hypothetical protein